MKKIFFLSLSLSLLSACTPLKKGEEPVMPENPTTNETSEKVTDDDYLEEAMIELELVE